MILIYNPSPTTVLSYHKIILNSVRQHNHFITQGNYPSYALYNWRKNLSPNK